jgi:hypothetical protein
MTWKTENKEKYNKRSSYDCYWYTVKSFNMENYSRQDSKFINSEYVIVEFLGPNYLIKVISAHTVEVEKILLLLSCPISPLFWQIKFHKDVKWCEWSFIWRFLDWNTEDSTVFSVESEVLPYFLYISLFISYILTDVSQTFWFKILHILMNVCTFYICRK